MKEGKMEEMNAVQIQYIDTIYKYMKSNAHHI